MFLPLIGFAIWGFGKTIWKRDSSAESYRFSLGYRAYIVSGAPQLVRQDEAGIQFASLNLESKWLLFLYSLTFPQTGSCYYKKDFLVVFSLALSLVSPWSQARMCGGPACGREKRGDSQE